MLPGTSMSRPGTRTICDERFVMRAYQLAPMPTARAPTKAPSSGPRVSPPKRDPMMARAPAGMIQGASRPSALSRTMKASAETNTAMKRVHSGSGVIRVETILPSTSTPSLLPSAIPKVMPRSSTIAPIRRAVPAAR